MKLLKEMGWVKQSGKIDWYEITGDVIVISMIVGVGILVYIYNIKL